MSGLWARYNKLLDAQPLLTKALTSLTGFTLGDILAQNFIEDPDKPYDFMRTARLGSFGFLLHGTTGHYFYGFLDSKLPGTAVQTVATKVAIDQTIWVSDRERRKNGCCLVVLTSWPESYLRIDVLRVP